MSKDVPVAVMTCLCGETCASEVRLEHTETGGRLLEWACAECGAGWRHRIYEGESYTDLEAMSLRLAPRGADERKVAEYARRLNEAGEAERNWVRLGRLLRAWREKAGITQDETALRAEITPRDYKRLEAGEPRRRLRNVEKAVRGVAGSEEQMRLLVAPGRARRSFPQRLSEAHRRLRLGRLPVLMPVDDALMPSGMSEDARAVTYAIARAVVSNPSDDSLLFYTQMVSQLYWYRRLGGAMDFDDLTPAVVRPIKELIDVFDRCRSEREVKGLLGVVRRELGTFLTHARLCDSSLHFLLALYEEVLADEQLSAKLELGMFEPLEKYYTSAEGMLLALYDRTAPERRSVLADAMRRIDAWERRKVEQRRRAAKR